MQEEIRYFASFPKALKKLRGKHVALIKNKVVASGSEAISVLEQAKKRYPKKRVVLAYVPKEETHVLVGG